MNKLSLLIIVGLMLGINLVMAQTGNPKIAAELYETFQETVETSAIIEFKTKANLALGKGLASKEEKTTFVFNSLQTTAKNSQKDVIEYLTSNTIQHQPFWIVNAIMVTCNLEELEQLASFDEVKAIHPNPTVHSTIIDGVDENNSKTSDRPEAIEWGISKIRADEVWDLGITGEGVIVAGQDTGYEWDHAAIIDQYAGYDGNTADHNYHWWDAIHSNASFNPCGVDSQEPCDDHNHGTHTMGTMVGDDGGQNQIGVAPGAKWIACRNMDNGNGTPTSYIECFEFFLAPTDLDGNNPDPSKAPDVINNSWGCPTSEGCNSGNWHLMEQVVDNLKSAGVVVVVSAGNDGSNCSTINSPASIFENSFTVGSTTSSDAISSFSSRGPITVDQSDRLKPNVSAPGSNVRSAVRNGGYSSFSGTSMAGPHVAGAVALVLQANPALSVEEVESILEQSAVPLTTVQSCGDYPGSEVPNATFGHGRIDAYEAVMLANQITSTSPSTLSTSSNVYLSPNPFTDNLKITVPVTHGTIHFELSDQFGNAVLTAEIERSENEIDLSGARLQKGLYYYTIESDTFKESGKVYKN